MTWHEAQLLRAMCKGKAYKQFGDDYTATHTNAETSGDRRVLNDVSN